MISKKHETSAYQIVLSSLISGWIRLQNGYYLPIHSADRSISFLTRVSTRAQRLDGDTTDRMGSSKPLFREAEQEPLTSSMLNGGTIMLAAPPAPTCEKEEKSDNIALAHPLKKNQESLRAAVHMDAMAFGMGCCCLQITFQATDIDESRFIYDHLAVMAPM
jgi:hypothetical protein